MIQNNLATLCKKNILFFKICSVKVNDPTSQNKHDQMEGSVKTLPSISDLLRNLSSYLPYTPVR